jgi:peptidoglycan/xylan/chitin deacetylase (PgdA/CDA1 family)
MPLVQPRRNEIPLPILVYHKVDPRRELGVTSLSPQRFKKQIIFLKTEGYTSISPQSLLYPIVDTMHWSVDPPRYRPLAITFDDGYEGIYTYAYPILKEFKFTAIIFVTTGYIGRRNKWDKSPGPRFKHLDWGQIREMADGGIQFGSHGVNHSFLTKQNDSVAKYEIEASKKVLEDGLGQPVDFFSYPYGDYDERIINFVRESGYKAAFSLRPELLKAEYINDANLVYALPRVAIYLLDGMWSFKAKIGFVRIDSLPYIQKARNRLINKCAYASMLIKRPGSGNSV